MRGLAKVGIVVCLALLAGCASKPTPVTTRPPAHPTAPLSPEAYVLRAGSLDLLAIRSSQLALARARDPRLRTFAQRSIRSHRGTSGQLSLAARRLNLLPAAALLPRHEAMLAELAATGDFDSAYRRLQLESHDEAERLHQDYSLHGTSPTLRPVAAAALALVRADLGLLKRPGMASRSN
jgi:predicted outer membrane protein